MTQSSSASQAKPAVELTSPSVTLRVGRRRLTLTWRARKSLPSLLSSLLRRSWRRLAPSLRVSVAAAAVCGAWQVPALAAAPAANTLPTGWSVVNGNVVFTQNGNVLNINQLSPQAIANFVSFSIGADASVVVNQTSSSAALLARVTGGDISQIYGKLSAPGTVVLYNPNGLVVGAGGIIDVGRFIGTTLNISNDDFLAGRLTFAKSGTAGAVDNQGTIQSASGGSVYLIGSSVSNSGIIKSPQGEVILAAGETVTLADTATPGVTVNVTGATGNVTNLGTITAEAGRIGIAAGLISNSGNISASSAVREGGRIFLRASSNLTTSATSSITADGTTGGNITLYSDNRAYIDGDVSAIGTAGNGGFVETSGLGSLDVVKVPTVGAGGIWYIDPYDLTVVSATDGGTNSTLSNGTQAITSNSSGATILNSTINALLNNGTSVSLVTGGSCNTVNAGDITVNAAINKTSGASANLTLNAYNNITINANITSGGSSGGLNLTLHTGVDNYSGGTRLSTIGSAASVVLGGGTLSVLDDPYSNRGALQIDGRLILGSGDSMTAGNTTIGTGGLFNVSANASVALNALTNNGTINVNANDDANLDLQGSLVNNGTINYNGGDLSISCGTVTNQEAGVIVFGGNDKSISVYGNDWTNNGNITVNGSNLTVNFGGGESALQLTNGGKGLINISSGTLNLNNADLAGNIAIASGGKLSLYDTDLRSSVNFTGSGSMQWLGTIGLYGNVTIGSNGPALTLGSSGYSFTVQTKDETLYNFNTSNRVTVLSNSDETSSLSGITWNNYGVVNFGIAEVTGSVDGAAGSLSLYGASSFNNQNGGVANVNDFTQINGGGNVTNQLGGTMLVGTHAQVQGLTANYGNLTVSGKIRGGELQDTFDNYGNLTLNGGEVDYTYINNNAGAVLGGSGTLISNCGTVNSGTFAPGGNGTIGTITVSGDLTFNANGTLALDFGNGSADQIVMSSCYSTVYLGGTLNTHLLSNYSGTVGTSYTVIDISAGASFAQGYYFRNVTGDVLTVNGSKQMIKAVMGTDANTDAPTLSMTLMGAATLYANGSGGTWSDIDMWYDSSTSQTAGYLPTQIDTVVLGSGATATHSSGTDTIDKLVLNGGTLSVTNGNLTVASSASGTGTISVGSNSQVQTDGFNTMGVVDTPARPTLTLTNAVTDANVTINTGNLVLNGQDRFANMTLASNGTVTGNAGSYLSVSNSFSQSGGTVSLANASLTQVSGNLTVGNITAANLVLEAKAGSISQNQFSSLHVTNQLIAKAVTGIDLSAPNGTNQIAAFAATNTGNGNITLVNHLNTTDASVVTINGVNTANGSISLENYGGMRTAAIGTSVAFLGSLPLASGSTLGSIAGIGINDTGQVKASGTDSTVSLVTHSPLTIGSGGVSASGTITLTAGTSSGSSSALTVNGVLVSLGGNITLSAGESMTINANISTSPPGVALLSVTSGAVIGYATGVTITDVNGTTTPVPVSTTSGTTSASQQAVNNQQNQTTQSLQNTVSNTQLGSNTIDTGTVTQSTTTGNQTVGGTAGNFGDETNSKSDGKKALPMCT